VWHFIKHRKTLLVSGAYPASKFRGRFQLYLVIKCHYRFTTVTEMKYTSRHCCDKTIKGKMALYRKCYFPNCSKSWWIKLLSQVFGGAILPLGSAPDWCSTDRSQSDRNTKIAFLVPLSGMKPYWHPGIWGKSFFLKRRNVIFSNGFIVWAIKLMVLCNGGIQIFKEQVLSFQDSQVLPLLQSPEANYAG